MSHPNLKLLLLATILGVNFGCSGAQAMGKRQPQTENPIPTPVSTTKPTLPDGSNPPTPPPAPTTDRYKQGLDLGTQNGERLITSIKNSTVGTQGCSGAPAYEKALLAVVKSVRPPKPGVGEDLEIARGFYKGYSTAFGKALRSGRVECELPTVVTGELPGTVIGDLLCGVGAIDVQLLDVVQVEPIYTGWSGGRGESKSECENVAVKITKGCTIGRVEDRDNVEKILNDQIALGCAD